MTTTRLGFALLLSLASPALGCNGDDDATVDAGEPDAGEPDAGEPDAGADAALADADIDAGRGPAIDADIDAGRGPVPATCPTGGEVTHLISNSLVIPEGDVGAFDLDNEGHPDNKLGGVFGFLGAQGIDVSTSTATAVEDGDIVLLHEVKVDAEGHASWQLFRGNPIASPKFDGTDEATVASGAPTSAPLCGKQTGGQVLAGPGEAHVRLSFNKVPFDLRLKGARIKANVTSDGCMQGVLGGGVDGNELTSALLPGVAAGVNATIADDHPAGQSAPQACVAAGDECPPTHDGQPTSCRAAFKLCLQESTFTVVKLLDTEEPYGMVTGPELANNPLVGQVLSNDVDLDGNGENDALSLSLDLTCVKASFTTP